MLKPRNGRPGKRRKRKRKTRVSRKEAAAEIESDGRRKEIAEEIIGLDLKVETFFVISEKPFFYFVKTDETCFRGFFALTVLHCCGII